MQDFWLLIIAITSILSASFLIAGMITNSLGLMEIGVLFSLSSFMVTYYSTPKDTP